MELDRNEEAHPVFQCSVPVEDEGEVRSEPRSEPIAPQAREPVEEKPVPGYEGPARGAPRYGGFDWN